MTPDEAIITNSFNPTINDQIKLLDYLPNKLTYQYSTTDNQFAVFSEIFYEKGWKAFINGKQQAIHEVNFY